MKECTFHHKCGNIATREIFMHRSHGEKIGVWYPYCDECTSVAEYGEKKYERELDFKIIGENDG